MVEDRGSDHQIFPFRRIRDGPEGNTARSAEYLLLRTLASSIGEVIAAHHAIF